ncbi:MAG: Phenylalanine-tRNA ligase alpha subunit [candidate division TM6 bacterium GW2011_GWF2_38_10]|nr:MAG: Phenylalanine-tRNA ligase alpha subunit [candidate division TM6 bacterium GW2011_GWF2_38_10]
MQSLKEQIKHIVEQRDDALRKVLSIRDIEDLRVLLLGKKGQITALLALMKTLSLEEKKEIGPLIHALKQETENCCDQAKEQLTMHILAAEKAKKEHFDVTAYLPKMGKGHRHPYSFFIEEIQDIFMSMGYEIIDGPEIETESHNFTYLNIPQDHPARDTQDTIWIDRTLGLLMRSQTSTVQVHAMQDKKLPLAVVAPGRVYRQEATDASHDFMFMQCEGLFIAENVSLAHLFGTAQTFLKKLFNKEELDIRIRPGFFPFVEPGVEIDMRCPFCTHGCSVCKKSTWIEVFPGGLVHPNVLTACGIDATKYAGFAFGFGLTRLVMLKYGINDIRLLHSGKVKFLEQF